MIISDGYSLWYEPKNNRIVITLPQTSRSVTNTVSPFAGRRFIITKEEQATILNVVRWIFERKEE